MSILDWFVDSFPSSDVLDLYFVLSDLKDIVFKPGELEAMAANDAYCKQRYKEVLAAGWKYNKSTRHWTGPEGQDVANGKMVF